MKLSSNLPEKDIISILHFTLFLNVTQKTKTFAGSCWVIYPKQGHKYKKSNPCSWTTHVDNVIRGVR